MLFPTNNSTATVSGLIIVGSSVSAESIRDPEIGLVREECRDASRGRRGQVQ